MCNHLTLLVIIIALVFKSKILKASWGWLSSYLRKTHSLPLLLASYSLASHIEFELWLFLFCSHQKSSDLIWYWGISHEISQQDPSLLISRVILSIWCLWRHIWPIIHSLSLFHLQNHWVWLLLDPTESRNSSLLAHSSWDDSKVYTPPPHLNLQILTWT